MEGVKLYPTSIFYAIPKKQPAKVLLGFANLDEEEFDQY
ncbi:DNA-binding transcriptional MocR family regulator [Lysinibacillus sp. RC79]